MAASPNSWLFSEDDLQYTPSRADGISYDREMYERAKGVDLIVRVGSVRVNVPVLTVATASLFLHRFYMIHSLQEYPAREVSMACLFLAGKVEESLRKVEAVVNYCLRLEDRRAGKEPDVHPSSEPFKKLVAQVLYLEEVILVALQFDLTVTHPHPIVSRAVNWYTTSSGSTIALSSTQATALGRCAWQILSDIYSTPLCTLHSPSILAAAAVLLAYQTIDSLPAFSMDDYRQALSSATATNKERSDTGAVHGDELNGQSEETGQEIDRAVAWIAKWWQKARNESFRESSRRLAKVTPKIATLCKPTTMDAVMGDT